MHMANNLPDGKLRLQFNFPGMNFHFSQVTGYGNYEALKDCKNVCYISQLEQASCLHGQDKV